MLGDIIVIQDKGCVWGGWVLFVIELWLTPWWGGDVHVHACVLSQALELMEKDKLVRKLCELLSPDRSQRHAHTRRFSAAFEVLFRQKFDATGNVGVIELCKCAMAEIIWYDGELWAEMDGDEPHEAIQETRLFEALVMFVGNVDTHEADEARNLLCFSDAESMGDCTPATAGDALTFMDKLQRILQHNPNLSTYLGQALELALEELPK